MPEPGLDPRLFFPARQNFPTFSYRGTNTYLIGTGATRLLLDTGEGRPSWTYALHTVANAQNCLISHALLTHWHPDHTGGIPDLLSLYPSAKIHKHDPAPGQEYIHPNQTFAVEGATLRAVHCPGHTTDHTAFVLEEESAMFTGDNLLGHGTAVFEDLPTYLASLHHMRTQFSGRAYPGHGAVVEDGPARIGEYIRHRRQREEEVLRVLGDGEGWTAMQIVRVVYREYEAGLHRPAMGGVEQVLRKLEGQGKVRGEGGRWWGVGGRGVL